jgi:glycosyltransferase involved in cell wall biosynthesis
MKIALLHYSSPPAVGGVEEVIKQQALLFRRHGHEVIIISGKGGQLSENISIVINPIFSSRNPSVDKAHREL